LKEAEFTIRKIGGGGWTSREGSERPFFPREAKRAFLLNEPVEIYQKVCSGRALNEPENPCFEAN